MRRTWASKPPIASLASGVALLQSRGVQFKKTADMNAAMNTSNAAAQKWVTKSTADFAVQADAAIEAGVLTKDSDRKRTAAARKAAADKRGKELQVWADGQRLRIADFQRARQKRFGRFFARYGWTMVAVYCCMYVVGLGMCWVVVKAKLFDKLTFFEFVFSLLGGYIKRERFFGRVEAWGEYIDFGFAFCINECLDVLRVPLSFAVWWTFRKFLIRAKTKSVFRWNSPEYDVELKRVQLSVAGPKESGAGQAAAAATGAGAKAR